MMECPRCDAEMEDMGKETIEGNFGKVTYKFGDVQTVAGK